MYHDYFKMQGSPFSIAPNPDFLFISDRHREALEHLLYGLNDTGGFILLTGEVGTGKTTMARTLLRRLDDTVRVTSLLNPQLEGTELLASVCDGFQIEYPLEAGMKVLTDRLSQFLRQQHQQGISAMLLIDEAQQLSRESLELLRLLTNLETDTQKLLRIVLVGQPELNVMLRQSELRQLAQRITARYQLLPFTLQETTDYIHYRLGVVKCQSEPFQAAAINRIYRYTGGIARLINLVCDRSLLAAYMNGQSVVSPALVEQSAKELELSTVSVAAGRSSSGKSLRWLYPVSLLIILGCGWLGWQQGHRPEDRSQLLAYQQQQQQIQQQWQNLQTQPSPEPWAIQQLVRAWGYQIPVEQASCALLKGIGLQCLRGESDLAGLRKQNYPVVVPLDWQNQRYYAVLRTMQQHLTLWMAGQQLTVSQDWLLAHWKGEYMLIWRPFPQYQGPFSLGEKGDAVAALAQRLALVNGHAASSFPHVYNDGLRQQVLAFQKQYQLNADGIAGDETVLMLMRILHPEQPALQEPLS
ncbi:AAA family ATPase [Celerinatantimonas sp. YJH-8]|uniref:ExeA family protein n=1 Tax=Celerinatantimonas sp. YJH-8 TaxID=3228714 RepID=UPI0038C5D03B